MKSLPRGRCGNGWCVCLRKLFFLGVDKPAESDKVSHALQPLVTLFAFFLAQVVAATIAEQGKGIRYVNIAAYLVLGLWTLVSIFTISRWTSERLTFITGHVILWLCLVLWVAFAGFALLGRLPGQGLLLLGVSNIEYADDVVLFQRIWHKTRARLSNGLLAG